MQFDVLEKEIIRILSLLSMTVFGKESAAKTDLMLMEREDSSYAIHFHTLPVVFAGSCTGLLYPPASVSLDAAFDSQLIFLCLLERQDALLANTGDSGILFGGTAYFS